MKHSPKTIFKAFKNIPGRVVIFGVSIPMGAIIFGAWIAWPYAKRAWAQVEKINTNETRIIRIEAAFVSNKTETARAIVNVADSCNATIKLVNDETTETIKALDEKTDAINQQAQNNESEIRNIITRQEAQYQNINSQFESVGKNIDIIIKWIDDKENGE